jgi:hypothetical protein
MYNIVKIENGFKLDFNTYQFIDIDREQYNIISDTQAHIYTNNGIILLDLGCAIDYKIYDNMVDFIYNLYS